MKAARTPPKFIGAAVPATSTTSQTHVEEFTGQESDRVFRLPFRNLKHAGLMRLTPARLHSGWSRQSSGIEDVRQAGTMVTFVAQAGSMR